jgi:hypothetical protein
MRLFQLQSGIWLLSKSSLDDYATKNCSEAVHLTFYSDVRFDSRNIVPHDYFVLYLDGRGILGHLPHIPQNIATEAHFVTTPRLVIHLWRSLFSQRLVTALRMSAIRCYHGSPG